MREKVPSKDTKPSASSHKTVGLALCPPALLVMLEPARQALAFNVDAGGAVRLYSSRIRAVDDVS
jgi:hypothetical protein